MAYKYKFGDFTYSFLAEKPSFSQNFNIRVEKSKDEGSRFLMLKIVGVATSDGDIKISAKDIKFDLSAERNNSNSRGVLPSSKITKALRENILMTFKKKYAQYIAKPMTAKAKKEMLKKYTKAEIEKAKKRGEKMLKSAKKK